MRHKNTDQVLLNEAIVTPRDRKEAKFNGCLPNPCFVCNLFPLPHSLILIHSQKNPPSSSPFRPYSSFVHRFRSYLRLKCHASWASSLCCVAELFYLAPPPLPFFQALVPLRRSCGGGWRTVLRSSGISFAARWRNWPAWSPATGRSMPTRSCRTLDTRRGALIAASLHMKLKTDKVPSGSERNKSLVVHHKFKSGEASSVFFYCKVSHIF